MSNEISSNKTIVIGFILAGAYNILGMLTVSKLFTNELLSAHDPAVFSWLGQIAIVLWGLAYLSVASAYRHAPYLVAVFCAEKIVYTGAWILWLLESGQALPEIASISPLTASFFATYGAGDLAFAIFFGWVAVTTMKSGRKSGEK